MCISGAHCSPPRTAISYFCESSSATSLLSIFPTLNATMPLLFSREYILTFLICLSPCSIKLCVSSITSRLCCQFASQKSTPALMPIIAGQGSVPDSNPSGTVSGWYTSSLSVPVPPNRIGRIFARLLNTNAPAPCIPCSPLCPAIAAISTLHLFISMGKYPILCAQSTKNSKLFCRASIPSSYSF